MNYTYNKDIDTRDGREIFVLKLIDSLGKEEFIKTAENLRELGAYYSPFKKGFVFKEDKQRELSALLGEQQKRTVDIEEIKKISIVSFCEQNGIALKGQGKWHSLVEHDSLVINSENNTFIWNSKGISGDIINFVEAYYDVDFKNAVEIITGEKIGQYEHHKTDSTIVIKEPNPEELEKVLNESKSMRNIFAYLIKTRKLDKETVQEFVDKKLISQDNNNNLLFKTYDQEGNLVALSRKGTGAKFYQKIEPDSMNIGFKHKIGDAINRVLFFEAPIDLMSYYEMNKNSLNNCELVSMNGLKYSIIERYLEEHPLKDVVVCVDNDEAGEKFKNSLSKLNGVFFKYEVPNKKDWNEDLQEKKTIDGYEKIKKIASELDELVKKICTNKNFLEYVEFASKFYYYSARNQLLIYGQRGDAQFVASKRHFKEKHCIDVKEGAKPIKILVPNFKEVYDDGSGYKKNIKYAPQDILEKIRGEIKTEKELVGYFEGDVFDLSQTTAPIERYPEILRKEKMIGDSNIDYEKTFQKLKAAVEKNGINVHEKDLSNADLKLGIKGYVVPGENNIYINRSEDVHSKICVLFHEYAHTKLGHEKTGQDPIQEIEAETIAYIMAKKMGIDATKISSEYISGYAKKLRDFKIEEVVEKRPIEDLRKMIGNISKGIKEIQKITNDAIEVKLEKKMEIENDVKLAIEL